MEKVHTIVENSRADLNKNNKRMRDEMEKCEGTIRLMQEKKWKLREDMDENERILRVVDPSSHNKNDRISSIVEWYRLSYDSKWKKGTVLAMLLLLSDEKTTTISKVAKEIGIDEENWNKKRNRIPKHIRVDRDVLLARLHLESFSDYYLSNGIEFHLQKRYRKDKEVVLATIQRYPFIIHERILKYDNFLDDNKIFYAFLSSDLFKNNHKNKARNELWKTALKNNKAEFHLNQFSIRIRSDAILMLQAARVTNKVFYAITGDLLDNQKFAIDVLNCIVGADNIPADALGCFSKKVRANHKVVKKYVGQNGLCLQYASTSLRSSKKIVNTAIKSNPYAIIDVAPCSFKQTLVTDKKHVLDLIRRSVGAATGNKPGRKLFQTISPSLQRDFDVLIESKKCGILHRADIPKEINKNSGFWIDAIGCCTSFWYILPDEFKDSVIFTKSIKSYTEQLVKDVDQRYPSLNSDCHVWEAIIKSCGDDGGISPCSLHKLLIKYAGGPIISNRNLMMLACQYDAKVISLLNEKFQIDRAFNEILVSNHANPLAVMVKNAQIQYPDLLIDAIFKLSAAFNSSSEKSNSLIPKSLPNHFVSMIHEDAFQRADVVQAWIRAGGISYQYIPFTFKSDKNFCLSMAKFWSVDGFLDFVGYNLRSDKDFMIKAIEINWRFYNAISEVIRYDKDVMLRVYGCDQGGLAFRSFDYRYGSTDPFYESIISFRDHVRKQLANYDAYMHGFLVGVSRYSGPTCSLTLLEQGGETGIAIKKLVAEFLGVPKQSEAVLYFQARIVVSRFSPLCSRDHTGFTAEDRNEYWTEDYDSDTDELSSSDDESIVPYIWGI